MSGLSAVPMRTVVVGEEFAATLVAAGLSRTLDRVSRPVQVLVLPAATTDAAQPADATLPWHGLPRVRTLLEDAAVIAAGGSFSWGIALTGWAGRQAAGFNPFGSVGAPFGPIGFQHLVQRLRREGTDLRFANHCVSALAAQAGRFERPGPDARSVLSTAEYGLHVDLPRTTASLRRQAIEAGASFAVCVALTARRDAQGRIAALVTPDGRRFDGDFFIDCSRRGAVVGSGGNASDWLDWSPWFAADRVLSCHAPALAAPQPYSQAHAVRGGWLRRVPVQGRTALTACFSAPHIDDTSLHVALRELAGTAVSDVRIVHARNGRMARPWLGNSVVLGPAAACIEPLVVSELQLLCAGLERLLHLLPADGTDMQAEATEFNRRFGGYAERARDLAITHYWLNGRVGEPFWDAVRDMQVPDSLAAKRELYEGRGHVSLYDDEPLEQWGWINLFDEMGLRPRCHSPLADGVPREQLAAHAARARSLMLEAVARMPTHAACLAGIKPDAQGGAA